MESQLTVLHTVATIQPHQLAGMVQCNSDKFLIVDSRTFCEYNTSHILNSVNVWSSKIRKKRLQQNSISVFDYLQQACQVALQKSCLNEIVVYDQCASCPSAIPADSFLYVLLHKLKSSFDKVSLLTGGFLGFQSLYPEHCEDSIQKASPLTSLSQPCLPVAKSGPTRILPFLFLGSQLDANDKQLLMEHNITYELNVSTSCPKPDFLQDSHFMRIAVNDNFSEKLLPHFSDAFRFIDKVREVGGRVLVHCLAGISRSATVAIAFVMKHLNLHYDEAYRYVKARRPTISPNINFVGQLLELDRKLFGDGLIYRSPTAPLYCGSQMELSPIEILRSSSSSCVESCRQRASLSDKTPSSPSSALASLSLFSCLKSNDYISDRLPSSPVTPPKSPEFFCSYSLMSAENSRRLFSSRETTPRVTSSVDKEATTTDTSTNYTFSTTASFNVNSQASGDCASTTQPMCVLEVTHEPSLEVTHEPSPLTFVDVQNTEPMVVHETMVMATPIGTNISEDERSHQQSPLMVTNRVIKSQTSEENNNVLIPSSATPPIILSATPPIIPKSPAPKKVDSKHFPRSYSASETHLNTKRQLENQNSLGNPSEVCTRKSFSSDEVGKGFQSSNKPPSPVVFNRDSVMKMMTSVPSELARCDSWSTSGLGSEISDWDSLQDDNHSILTDDTQGPFDAVFADVYPGEWQESPLKKLSSSSSLKDHEFNEVSKRVKVTDARQQTRQMKRQHRNVYYTSSLNDTTSSTKESITNSPTPRPVSLPGVTGTYITNINTIDSNSNIDMGVEMDDPDWQSEKEQELYQFDPRKSCRRSSSVTEHSPVNPRTMGDNVRHIKEVRMSFHDTKEDLLSRRLSKRGSTEDHFGKIAITKTQDRLGSTSPLLSTSVVPKASSPDCDNRINSRRNSLEDRWKAWDSEYPKKMQNIQTNLCTWDTMDDDDECEKIASRDTMAGFHLAQELMQSMEDLLENEINDIKRQASALSTKYGLDTKSMSHTAVDPSSDRGSTATTTADILSKPGIIDPSSNRSTISFCPSLQQGIIRSGKLKNIHQQPSSSPSVKFEYDFSTPKTFSFVWNPTDAKKKLSYHRAKSEPADEGLYRARSCPGIPQDNNEPKETFLRHPKPSSGNETNRYSCGALDSMQSFESCPDISKLKRFLVDSTSSGSSSTHSSFNRLLQVS